MSNRLRFVLSGSSARKLRRSRDVNLLAGRAITTPLFPLVSAELSFKLDLQADFTFWHTANGGHG